MRDRSATTAGLSAAPDESAAKAQMPPTLPEDIRAMLHNLISLHLNGYVSANHHRIRTILVRADNGVWAASRHFPKTVGDFVTLSGELSPCLSLASLPVRSGADEELEAADMAALKQFYDIKSVHESSVPAWRVENMLFHDIALTFGLTYWL